MVEERWYSSCPDLWYHPLASLAGKEFIDFQKYTLWTYPNCSVCRGVDWRVQFGKQESGRSDHNPCPLLVVSSYRWTTKINVDAGCFTDSNTGWGFIARNHQGEVLFSATRKEHSAVTPLMAETLALIWCLSWAEGKQFTSLCIETDVEMVVHCLYRRKRTAVIEFLILDCLDYLSRLSNCTF